MCAYQQRILGLLVIDVRFSILGIASRDGKASRDATLKILPEPCILF